MTIRYAARANLYHLQQFLNGQQRDSPHDTIQALDVVMRESPSLKYDNSAISSPFLFCNFLFCWSCWPCDHWFHFVLQLCHCFKIVLLQAVWCCKGHWWWAGVLERILSELAPHSNGPLVEHWYWSSPKITLLKITPLYSISIETCRNSEFRV